MNTQPKQKISVQTLTQLAILVAIEVVMKLIGLGSVPVGPLYMSFLTVPTLLRNRHRPWPAAAGRHFRFCEFYGCD